MLDNHTVPHTDIYSFTMRGHPWISMQWVAEVLYAEPMRCSLERAGGADRRGERTDFRAAGEILSRHLSRSATIVFVAAALALRPSICWRGRMCWRCRSWWHGLAD